MDLAGQLQAIKPKVRPSPWVDHEHVRGYAVLMLPFASDHLLGLRVFPESDFAPYASVWHRTPNGGWSIYNDGPSLKTTCPRWWGPAARHTALTRIDITWTNPTELRVAMDDPSLMWTLSVTTSPLLRALNAVSVRLPRWTWKHDSLLRVRTWAAKQLLGLGDLRFSFTSPSGHDTVIMPEQMFFIDASEAVWKGRDLGNPVRLDATPTIGGIPLPRRPTFMIGQAYARIQDHEEYRRTRERVHVDNGLSGMRRIGKRGGT